MAETQNNIFFSIEDWIELDEFVKRCNLHNASKENDFPLQIDREMVLKLVNREDVTKYNKKTFVRKKVEIKTLLSQKMAENISEKEKLRRKQLQKRLLAKIHFYITQHFVDNLTSPTDQNINVEELADNMFDNIKEKYKLILPNEIDELKGLIHQTLKM